MIDVVIVNFNSSRWTTSCLKSFQDEINEQTVYVFLQDNGSSDGLASIKRAFPAISLTENKKNIGFSQAVNKALKMGASEYAVLLNPDTIVTDGFLSSSVKYMEEHDDVGVLGPAILNPDETVQGSARAFPGFLTALFGRNSALSRLLPENPITRANILNLKSDGVTPIEVDWVSGACMVVRRKAINEVGLLDPRFFLYWEDADWCKRMWEKGWKVVYLPSVKVIHQVGASSSTRPVRSSYQFHKSAFKLFYKHVGNELRLLSPLVAFALGLRFGLVGVQNLYRRMARRGD